MKKNLKKTFSYLLTAMTAAALAGTGHSSSIEVKAEDAELDLIQTVYADDDTGITITIASDANRLDSLDKFDNEGHGQDDTGYLWGDPLVSNDHRGSYSAALAREWTMAEDGLSCRFVLRQDVTFHNGKPLTSQDVKVTFERLLDDSLQYKNSWTTLERVEIIDDYTLVIYLNSVMPTFLDEIGFVPIISSEDYEADPENFFQKPIGTGAYMVDCLIHDEKAGDTVCFTRNEDWWGENTGNADHILYQCIIDETERSQKLQNGSADIVTMLTVDYHDILDDEGYHLVDLIPDFHVHLAFRSAPGKIFQDYDLRAAISMCIDREMLVDSILGGGATADWPIQEGIIGYVESDGYEYDPEKAAQFVAASDYDGEEVSLIYTAATMHRADEVAQVIQSRAMEIGINLILEPLDEAEFMSRRASGDYDIALGGFTATCGDPQTEVAVIIANDVFHTGYTNTELKELSTEMQTILDREERIDTLETIFQIEMDSLEPFVYLYSPMTVTAMTDEISGITFYSDYSADYRFVVKQDAEAD